MAIDLSKYLTNEQRNYIAQQNVQQFAAEAFAHTINRSIAEKIGNEEQVAVAEAALIQLEVAINEWSAAAQIDAQPDNL